jgi:hypothetical protein
VKNVVRSGKNYAVIKRIQKNVLIVERLIASIENYPKGQDTVSKPGGFLVQLNQNDLTKPK